ncbi:MAG: Uncharacterized protein FD150_816 [Rhodobacteraceae bacterium]|nr:MAG: Uncharacterized protein FD150_816 [Paracoccaceae bacterium]
MTPISIYQAALDVVSEAVLAGDFAVYAAMIDLPYLVLTDSAQLLITREADLRPTFDALHLGLKARGVHHYKRLARQADYVARGRIEGWHFTHVLSERDFAVPSRSARQVIVHRDGRWHFSEAQYPIAADRWPLSDHMLFADPLRTLRPEGAIP